MAQKIIGAAMEVHNTIGQGHLEAVYQECLGIEISLRASPFASQPKLPIYYKDRKLKKYYVPDFIILQEIAVEIKAEKTLTNIDEAQIINSLKTSRKEIGLLVNFGEPSLRFKRYRSLYKMNKFSTIHKKSVVKIAFFCKIPF